MVLKPFFCIAVIPRGLFVQYCGKGGFSKAGEARNGKKILHIDRVISNIGEMTGFIATLLGEQIGG